MLHIWETEQCVPGVCTVVMVVVVIRVVVVSSSEGDDVTALHARGWPADDVAAVVRTPGDIMVDEGPDWWTGGTACVGLVVVPGFKRKTMPH